MDMMSKELDEHRAKTEGLLNQISILERQQIILEGKVKVQTEELQTMEELNGTYFTDLIE